MKLTCITNKGWSGVVEALNTTVKIVGSGRCLWVDDDIRNNFRIFNILNEIESDIILVGGYGPIINGLINTGANKKSKVVVLWCSNILQSELTGEMDQFNMILSMLRAKRIHSLAFIEKESYVAMKNLFPKENFSYMPVVPIDRNVENKAVFPDDSFNVDVFCTPDGRKNIYNQLLALHDISKVHVNYSKPSYVNLVKNFPGIINHGRMSLSDLDTYSAGMNLCSQVSMNESFNYVAADHMYMGVPVLASRFVPAVFDTSSELIHKHLIVNNPMDTQEIKEKSLYIKNNKALNKELGEISKIEIQKIHEIRRADLLESIASL